MNSRKKLLVIAAFALVFTLASVGVAYGVTNGQPDGDAHPYVGLLVSLRRLCA
jgi:hypothetical protein